MDQETLNNIGPRMDLAAYRLATADGYATPDEFARGYVLAVAETCGAEDAHQFADGVPWAPTAFLRNRRQRIELERASVGVPFDATLWTDAWERYAFPRPEAFDACRLPRRAP